MKNKIPILQIAKAKMNMTDLSLILGHSLTVSYIAYK